MSDKRLNTLQKAKILKQILDGQKIDHYFHEFSAPQMKDLRDFLENQILDLSKRSDENPLERQEIKGKYQPTPEYYHQQDCNEPLDSCLDETCYKANPVCFGLKMSAHMNILVNLIEDYVKESK
jgi:hypothetical protein